MWIHLQTDEWLLNIDYLWDIKVENNKVVARHSNGERIVLGEYYGQARAEAVYGIILTWLRKSAGPDNMVFTMPVS